jgi:hypothetical protein
VTIEDRNLGDFHYLSRSFAINIVNGYILQQTHGNEELRLNIEELRISIYLIDGLALVMKRVKKN